MTRPKPVTLADLRRHQNERGHVLLLCTQTGCELSANPSDYFMMSENHIFRCCGRLLRLVRKSVVYEDLR